jgi:beta-glucosidase
MITKQIFFVVAVSLCISSCKQSQSSQTDVDKRVDSVLNLMTVEEKVGQLTLYTSDWDVTGPSIRPGYMEDIKAGKVGAIFNAYTAKYTRQLQEIAVKQT